MGQTGEGNGHQHDLPCDHMQDGRDPVIEPLVLGKKSRDKRGGNDGSLSHHNHRRPVAAAMRRVMPDIPSMRDSLSRHSPAPTDKGTHGGVHVSESLPRTAQRPPAQTRALERSVPLPPRRLDRSPADCGTTLDFELEPVHR